MNQRKFDNVERQLVYEAVDGNNDAFESLYRADDLGYRQLEDIELEVASLLHELAHAADQFRPGVLGLVSENDTPYDAGFGTVADELQQFRPLESDNLASIASVLFHGVPPTPVEAAYSATKIGTLFAPDRASDLCSYSSQYEDVAMLFEETMMEILYGVQRDVAFTSIPADDLGADATCADLVVGWGMRGRIASTQVLERARLVMSQLLPERDYGPRLDQIKKPSLLVRGKDWCESIDLGASANSAPYRSSPKTLAPRQWQKRRFL